MAGLLTPNNQVGMQVQQDLNDYINQLKFKLDNTTDPTLRNVYLEELNNLNVPVEQPAVMFPTPMPEGFMDNAIEENPQPQSQASPNINIAQLLKLLGVR